MAIRNILEGDNPRLRKKSREVTKISRRTLDLLDDMAETMADARGVGLAAPQVGVLRRVVVIDVGDGIIELINPVIVSQEGSDRAEEACLSFPDKCGYVVRPEKIVVRALDRDGVEHEYTGEGILARALAHEIDHLDGVLFVDRVVEWVELDSDPQGR